ncbi:uncharacterized protein tbc1d10c isoform 1-T1 [Syngnathus typhle]
MLRTSSRGGLNMSSDEESSGSDAGSEFSPKLQTDRFGFIVLNGSETRVVTDNTLTCNHGAIALPPCGFPVSCPTSGGLSTEIKIVGPHPQLVRQREAKWINIIDQWRSILMKKTNMIKVQCQKGIPTSLRAKCWPLLCGATNRMNQNKQLFQSLDSQVALQKWVDIINRDLDRQFPFHEMFRSKDGHGQQGLFQVLKAYTQYQPGEGYCQAQGPVAAVLLMNMPAEEAFWCLVQISEHYLPGYYSPLLEGVLFDATVLTWVLKKTCPSAYKHLRRHEVEPLMFATDWLMCLFTRHLPFNALLRVWDLFFCNGVRVLLQVAVVLVRRVLGRAEQRKQCQDQMETLQRLRDVRCEVEKEDDAFIAEVCAVPLSSSDLEKHTEKELAKWKKDRPSSTFDPRGRCHGYRMAWERAQLNQAEVDRRARETGNLSVPLARSASHLSLSPSLLHKKWSSGRNVRVQRVGGGVPRYHSMGANDWRSDNELNLEMRLEHKAKQRQNSDEKKKVASAMTEMTQCTNGQNRPLLVEHTSCKDPKKDHIHMRGDCVDEGRNQIATKPRAEVTLNMNATKSESGMNNVAKTDTVDEIATSELQTCPELDQDKFIQAVNRHVVMVIERSLSQEEKHQRTESLTEINLEAQTERQTDVLAQTQKDEVGKHATMQQQLDDVQNPAEFCPTNTTCVTSLQCSHQIERTSEACSPCCQTESNNTNEPKESHKEIIPCLKQASVNGAPHFSGDICIRKSSGSRGSKLTQHLSKDLFTDPAQSVDAKPPDHSAHESKPPEPAKHFSLFRRQPKKYAEEGRAKIQIPTILIQDFSDGIEILVEEEDEEQVNSRERRRWWQRKQAQKEKKDEKLRKNKEKKEVKKANQKERRTPQTRGKGFQVQRETMKCSPSHAEAYF